MVNHEHNRTDAVDALQVFGDLLRQDRRLLGGHLARVFGEHDAKLEENMHAVALIMPHLETQPRPDRQGHEDDARAFRGWSGETVLNHLNVLSEYMDIDRRNVASELAMFGDDVTAHAWLSDQISADGDRSDKTKPVVYAVRYFDLDNGPPVAGSDWRLDPKDSLRYIKYLGAADDWRRAHSLAVAEKADLISFQGHVCRAEEGKREPGALVSTHHQTGHNPYQQPFFLMTRPAERQAALTVAHRVHVAACMEHRRPGEHEDYSLAAIDAGAAALRDVLPRVHPSLAKLAMLAAPEGNEHKRKVVALRSLDSLATQGVNAGLPAVDFDEVDAQIRVYKERQQARQQRATNAH